MEQKDSFSLSRFLDPKFLRPMIYEGVPQLHKHLFKQLASSDSSFARQHNSNSLEKDSFSLSRFLDPKFLRPMIYEGVPQLHRHLFKQLASSDSSLAGQHNSSSLENAAFNTVPIENMDDSDHQKKINFGGLIRGDHAGTRPFGGKSLTELITSFDDLNHQMPSLPNYSDYTVPEYNKQNFSEQGVSLIPYSDFVSSIDKPNEDEAQAQQKNVMDYIAELNKRSVQEQEQDKSPFIEDEALSHGSLEGRSLQEKRAFDGREAENKKDNASNFLDRFKKSEFSEHLMDFFAGLSQGETPEESFSNAGIALRQGNNERTQRKQTLEFLRSKGYSDEDAQVLAQHPDLVQKMIGNTLSSEEGYRTLTAEEKEEYGLPKDVPFQVSSSGKLIPVSSPDGGYRTLTAEEKAEYGLPEEVPFQVSSSGKVIPVSSPDGGYRTLTAEEKAEYGLPEDVPFQVSRSGKVIPIQGTQGAGPAAEAGYTLVKDKSTQSGLRAIPITGSAAERKLIKEKNEALLRYAEGIARGERLVNTSKDLMEILDENPRIVGTLGHLLSGVPGSEGAVFAAILKTLKSNIAIDTLQKMKSLAPNGASGFGNLSNVEFEALQNAVAALGTNLTSKQMKKSLQTIIDTYSKANRATKVLLFGNGELTVELVQEAYGITPDKQNDEKSDGSDDQFNKYFEAFPEGMLFVDSDGFIKEKQTNG